LDQFPIPPSVSAEPWGRVDPLDFWTYFCVNCIKVLPVLERSEECCSSEGLLEVGVHCPELPTECDPENDLGLARRHGVRHPGVLDPLHEICSRFTMLAWPALDFGGFGGLRAGNDFRRSGS
jgi:hypothetical protein